MKKGLIRRTIEQKILLPVARKLLDLTPVDNRRGGWFSILESYTGAWQQNVTVDAGVVDAYWANFACVTLIASDIAKMPINVMTYDSNELIWKKTAKRPVLRKPNHYQTSLEFIFSWVVSELRHGNTYILKERDPLTGFIIKLHVLDPCRVRPLITRDGGVYYELQSDNLSGLDGVGSVTVPASEIIHDRMYPLYHPLVGLPPVFACGIAAMQGSSILNTSAGFFANRGMPAGILTAPGHIPDDTAQRLKTYFDDNYTGVNAGKVAVLGDSLKFESLSASAESAQLIEQLKMTGEMIAACYHVPGYKIGVGPMPTVANTAALNQQYYEQSLQYIIEKMEARLDEGLELNDEFDQCWLDITVLMRMDPVTLATVTGQKVKDGIWSPNEARREDNKAPVIGGNLPFMQLQNYSIEDLARRSEQDKKKAEAVTEDGGVDVQSLAMNGAQVGSLLALLTAAAAGEIPIDSVNGAIAVAFPNLTDAQIAAIVGPLADFEQTPAPTQPAPTAPAEDPEPDEPPEDDPPEEDEEEEDDESKEFALLVLRSARERAVA